MERIVKGIFVPIELWESRDLSWNEKVVFLEVDSFTRRGKDCYISDEYVATLVGCSIATAKRIMANLIQKGYVRKTRFDGRHRFIETCMGFGFDTADGSKMSEQPDQNCTTTYLQTTGISITDIDNTCRKIKRFIKPSIKEVRAYCEERNNNVDPETFFDFYESKGWKVGREPMKDWKACVRTWEKTRDERKPQARQGARPDSFENMLNVGRELGIMGGPNNG